MTKSYNVRIKFLLNFSVSQVSIRVQQCFRCARSGCEGYRLLCRTFWPCAGGVL